MTSATNALGTFNYGFDGVTRRVTQVTGPNSLTSTFSYFGNDDDRRLQTILNKKSTTTLSQFDYTYDDGERILSWKRTGLATADAITYDLADQLKTYSKVNSSGGPTLHTYNYDTAGNRTDENIAPGTKNFTYNNVNQMLTSQVGSGTIKTYVHDNNGNLTDEAGARSYEWDDANRLKAIVEGTKRFEFTYDGLGRRYKMVYKTNGVTTFTRRFIWCGAQPCYEQYNTAGQPGATKRYFAQGVLEGSDKYFYMRDHLGSVREVMKNNSSTVEAKYDYDPWGRQTQTTGTRVFDIGYAGYMVFAPMGTNIKLNLTWYRAYSPELGRWLSRDPIGERGGLNLYKYANCNPLSYIDPLGLQHINGGFPIGGRGDQKVNCMGYGLGFVAWIQPNHMFPGPPPGKYRNLPFPVGTRPSLIPWFFGCKQISCNKECDCQQQKILVSEDPLSPYDWHVQAGDNGRWSCKDGNWDFWVGYPDPYKWYGTRYSPSWVTTHTCYCCPRKHIPL